MTKKYIFILSLLGVMIFIFTACGQNQDTTTPPLESELIQDVNSNQEPEHNEMPIDNGWQDAYAEILLLYATGQNLEEWEVGWEFALHDINQDGVPELFLGAMQMGGHIDYRYVYTFLSGEGMSDGVVRLDFEGFLTDRAMFSPTDNSPWVVAFLAVGSGGHYVKLEMIELGLVPTLEGMAFMSDEGHEMMFAYDVFDWQNYEWYNLSIDGIEVTTYEFEATFGSHRDRYWLSFHEVNEANIYNVIFSSLD